MSGSLKIGQEIDFPELKQQRKVKSMQMFKQPVNTAVQGDRLGVCVTQLDAKALERGIACTLGHVNMVSHAIISVRQIRFFKSACRTLSKFHITVGHNTVMGTATFFGPPRIPADSKAEDDRAVQLAKAAELARSPLPKDFDISSEYEYQDELDPLAAEQWAVLELHSPIPCALPAVAIGSHLDSEKASSCRLAFHGLLLRSISREELVKLRIFKSKQKEGQVDRVQDERTVICKNLFSQGTDMNMFLGMAVQLGEKGPVGKIESTFGKSKFKCTFPDMEGGLAALQEACKSTKLMLRYKRFVFDPQKKMLQ